jgi:hypothetical protein
MNEFNPNIFPKNNSNWIPKINIKFNSEYLYGLIPFIIIIILIIWKPNIITHENINNNGEIIKKIKIKKICTTTFILSIIVMLGIFGYKYQKDKIKNV